MSRSTPERPRARVSEDGRRRLPAAQRRELILRAAVRLFAERGYHATSMEEIGAAAGVSKAVVYDHFASKRELYTALLDEIRAEIDAAIDSAVEPLPSEERLRAAIETFFRFVEERGDACRLLFLEVHGTAEVAEIVARIEERVAAGLSSTLAGDPMIFAGHAERDRQVRILAELLKSAVHGLASWWYRHPDVRREELVERTIGVIAPALDAARGVA